MATRRVLMFMQCLGENGEILLAYVSVLLLSLINSRQELRRSIDFIHMIVFRVCTIIQQEYQRVSLRFNVVELIHKLKLILFRGLETT